MADWRSLQGTPLLYAASDLVYAITFDQPLPVTTPTLAADNAWPVALQIAIGTHGVGPLLGARIAQSDDSLTVLPADVRSWLASQVERCEARQARLAADLHDVLRLLCEAGAQPLALKGAALLLRDGPQALNWRPMSDLDLLVLAPGASSSVAGVAGGDLDMALAKAGYCLDHVSWKHRTYVACTPGPLVQTDGGEHPDNPRDVEIHQRVVEQFRGFRVDLTPHLLLAPRVTGDALLPNDAALSLHLAAHASVSLLEGMHRALHVVDLARTLAGSGPDGILQVVDATDPRFIARFVYPALALTARACVDRGPGGAIAASLCDMLQPHVPVGMVQWCATLRPTDWSWIGQTNRGLLNSQQIWAWGHTDRARMTLSTLLPSPSVLASDDVTGGGPLAWPGWYAQHYARLGRRVASRVTQAATFTRRAVRPSA